MSILNTYYVNESPVDDNHDFQYIRRLYIDECINKNGIEQFIKITDGPFNYINRHQLLENTNESIKDLYFYNDEYNHQQYITIISKLDINIIQGDQASSIAFFSDENGNNINENNSILIENTGNYLISTHYSLIFDINFHAYNILNNINDNEELDLDENQIIQTNLNKINQLTHIISNIDLCSICLDESNLDSNFIKTNCNHIYHKGCINMWISANYKNDMCPYCRTKI